MIHDVSAVCGGVFDQIIILINNIVLVFLIGVILVFIDYKLSILLIISGLVLTILFQNLIKKFLEEKGKILHGTRVDNVKLINQSFDIIKDAKIQKKEDYFINLFKSQLEIIGKIKISNAILIALPRPILELVIIIAIIMIIIYSTLFDKNFNTTLPYITFLAVSSVRLIPSLKLISNSISTINFNKISVSVVTNELNEMTKNVKSEIKSKDQLKPKKNLTNFKLIKFNNINFSYENKNDILKNISFEIKKGEKIGIVGPSGAGKSTLINIILGILEPNSGKITIDDIDIYKNLNDWYDLIGLIPQEVYLLQDTIKNNIALGEVNYDKKKLKIAIQDSNCETFIKSLRYGVETDVGNRGISFSGGQKQRIGIARALYHQPKILIMDEATNSLDNVTKNVILKKILKNKDLTVLAISHDLKSLSSFDKIIVLDNGVIKKIDTIDNIKI